MKKRIISLWLFVSCFQAIAMEPGYTTLVDAHRSYADYIPFDVAYVPSLLSVRHQMKKYGIAKKDGTGYEFAQLTDATYTEVTTILKELSFDYSQTYILKLNPAVRGSATTVLVTSNCIFIDEEEWQLLNNPALYTKFKTLVSDKKWHVEDPISTIKKYVIKRAITHFNNGTYRKKMVSKLCVGAAIGYLAYKAMNSVESAAAQADHDFGISASISAAVPSVATICSTLWIPTILKIVSKTVISSIITEQLQDVLHRGITKPYWKKLDIAAENGAVAAEPDDAKKLLVSYNKSQQSWKDTAKNTVLGTEYAWRAEHIAGMLQHQ